MTKLGSVVQMWWLANHLTIAQPIPPASKPSEAIARGLYNPIAFMPKRGRKINWNLLPSALGQR
jgi:hypothetical protein